MAEKINLDIKRSVVDIILLIRSIQRIEGNPDCFRRGMDSCDQMDCAWRKYCLEYEDELPLFPGNSGKTSDKFQTNKVPE